MNNENVVTNPRLLNFENMCSEKNINFTGYIDHVEFLQAYDDKVVSNLLDEPLFIDDDYDLVINRIIRYLMNNTDKNFIMYMSSHYVLLRSSYNELDNMDTVDDIMYNGNTLHIYSKYISSNRKTKIINHNRLWAYKNNTIYDKLIFDKELFQCLKLRYNNRLHTSFNINTDKYSDNIIAIDCWEDYDYYSSKDTLISDWSHNKTIINKLVKYPDDSKFSIKNSYKLIYSKYELDEEPTGEFSQFITGRIEFVCGLNIFSCNVETGDDVTKDILTYIDYLGGRKSKLKGEKKYESYTIRK